MSNDLSLENLKLFSGSSHPNLCSAIAKELGIQLGQVDLSTFSCGENYARIRESIRGGEAYVLQTIGPRPNDDYMKLFLIMDALKRASAKKIHVIIPHFGYARQDKKSAPREPISSRLIADLLSAVGFSRLITVDLHSDQIQGFFSQPVDHLTALPLFQEYFSKLNIPDLVVCSTDAGGAKFAKRLADRLSADLAIIYKTRPQHNVAQMTNVIGHVKDKNVLIVDDMVDTAGSVVAAYEGLKKFGAKDVYLAATHPVFSGPAIERVSGCDFKEVVVTDTLDVPKEKQFSSLKILSIAPLLAEAIKRNYENESISSLFN